MPSTVAAPCRHHHVFESPKPNCELVHGVCKFCGDEQDRPKNLEHEYGRVPRGAWGMWDELEGLRG